MAETELAMAERHVREGRRAVVRQREIVARKKAAGQNSVMSQTLLDTFERTLAAFEEYLAAIRDAA